MNLLTSRDMAARSFGFVLLGIVLGASAVELTYRPTPAVQAPVVLAKKTPPTFQPPTAEQAYRMQDDCVKRGRLILEQSIIGSALAQEQVSKYNPTTNRCFVLLNVHAADLTKFNSYDNSSYLEDGQTGEMLASYRIKPDQQRAFLGFGCGDFDCVTDKVADCMKGLQCDPE